MEKNQMKQTKFDSMVTNPTMQLVKAVIPYIDNSIGRYIGMFIKFQELQNAATINNNVSVAAMNADKHNGMESMLEDIIDFMDEDARETFENIKGMMEMMEAMNGMDMGENMGSDMMNAFMGSAFGGNDNSSNDDDASPFETNNHFTYDEHRENPYDENDDVTSSQMNDEKGFDDYE